MTTVGSVPDRGRRAEILDAAAALFASSGLRTSVKDVADACGILPGSLYHHFESKDAILVELVHRYQDELGRVAEAALADGSRRDARPADERVVELGRAIAACAVRHRAALLVTLYDPPLSASDELAGLARQTPAAIVGAMRHILDAGRRAGSVRRGVDLDLLAERLCLGMLHHGVGDSARRPGADRIPELRCRIVLHGLAPRTPTDAVLDRSAALRAVGAFVAGWDDGHDGDRAARVLQAARAEFGRRGYEATNMRAVAAAAGLTPTAVYRLFESKEALLTAVASSYVDRRRQAWEVVLATSSSAVEKFDALLWVNIHLLDRYRDAYNIQLGWLRESPPNFRQLGSSHGQRRAIGALLREGAEAGEIDFGYGAPAARARFVYEALWTPESIVRGAGPREAHRFARATLLRGALARP
jgi:AcrR family transcriptional regulator